MKKLRIFHGIGELLTLAGVAKKNGRYILEEDLSIIKKAAFVVDSGKVIWVGPQNKIPKNFAKKSIEVDLKNKTVLPGFVECHTHTIFSGNRAHEFELRNQGVSYQEIAAKGGGILSTTTATRKISATELQKKSQERVDIFLRQGVTTLEIKSGYALDEKNEIKCLDVARKLKGPRVVSTFLGAHALPSEFNNNERYLEFLTQKVLPKIKSKKLSKRVDIFIEKGFFETSIAEKYLLHAKQMGFEIVIHADQLSLSGGADLAVKLDAISADHLIQISEEQIQKLGKSQVTCVLLPAADLYMKCKYPPARKLIEAGARVALATDFNPGSSPTQDLSLVGLLARLEMKMTSPEVIAAYTYSSAAALNLHYEIGSIEENKRADFICTDLEWTQFFYAAGSNMVTDAYISGIKVK